MILRDPESRGRLIEFLESPVAGVQSVAIRAARHFRDVRTLPALRSLLADPRRDVDIWLEAAETLSRLGDRQSVTCIKTLLSNLKGCQGAIRLSRSLCRLGCQEGVPIILDEMNVGGMDPSLFVLNALRKPALWSTLHRQKLTRNLVGSTEQLLMEIGRIAELKVEFEDEVLLTVMNRRTPRGMLPRFISSRGGEATLLYAIEKALFGDSFEVILEEGKLRVLSEFSALQEWNDWWRQVRKKRNR